jgi:molybdopterin converting factor subunit 1
MENLAVMAANHRSGDMRVHLLLFAHYRDIAGTGTLELDVPAGSTAADVVRILRSSGGGYARLPDAPAIALNMEYVPLGTAVRDGDEVALLPPVAGG